MQTFLPFSDFRKSAEVLDKRRCWKQVVEASQIIDCLEGKKVGWRNHPAVKMWDGYENLLKHYYNVFLEYCLTVHKINTKMQYRNCLYSYGYDGKLIITEHAYNSKPFWFGQEPFHRAMRSRLIEKDPGFYGPKFPNDRGYNNSQYWWPVMEDQTFRTI
ncbi:MAG TPA: MSMEG_6728 family protein [Candidatus Paceibacterota bacterium]|jgi:hypothetical protein|nr:MSMEG_6728 family protein [Candidatus Paceibacterota bacterium]